MNRKIYIYTLVPCFTLLASMPTLGLVLGPMFGGLVSCLLIFVAWGLVWLRLFTNGRLRPEFSILTVLPLALYLFFFHTDKAFLAQWTGPAWQNLYCLLWLFAALVASMSMLLSPEEKREAGEAKDLLSPVMISLCFVYAFFTWLTCFNYLFGAYHA